MDAQIKDDKVVLQKGAIEELYNYGYYGRLRGETLELSLVEAAFLVERGKLDVGVAFKEFFIRSSVIQPFFELKYIVYKDLRERGYYVQPSITDFRVYPRGGRPGETPASTYVYVMSERIPVPFIDILNKVKIAQNVRKKMMLAIVDEESDLTYYEVKSMSMQGTMPPFAVNLSNADATFLEDRVMLWDERLSRVLFENGFFGKLIDSNRLQISLVECAYLITKGLRVDDGATGKTFSLKQFTRRAMSIEPDFMEKLEVYGDLRERGFVVKTGFKFGGHFRVYTEVRDIMSMPHSKYLVHSLPEGYIVKLPELSRSIRLAHGVRKRMIFAYSQDNRLQYVDIGRAKP
jgi:tRNA-intron endonuclease